MSIHSPAMFTGTVLALAIWFSNNLGAQDWPMWRYDAGRTAASNNRVPSELRQSWNKKLTPRRQAWDDPLNLDLMTYDRLFEPIVMEGRLFIGFNDADKLSAFDADTGGELWSFYTEAPVRLPPAGWRGQVFFCSDDGFLYCVEAASGELAWKFSGAPSAQHAIGNQRLTSAWPARGGPVVRDGVVYFAASIWPFMGTFIYALDAETGDVVWTNDSTGAQYIKQPHSAPSFAGVAPQGALVATEKMLLVPGGRSVPAAFDRASGELRYFEINAGGKGTGGSFVTADETHFYVHTRHKSTRAFRLGDGVKTAFMPSEPVLAGETIFSAEVDDGHPVVRAYDSNQKVLWQVEADGAGDLILADDQLVAAGSDAITILTAARDQTPGRVVGRIPVPGKSIQRLIAADQKLFAVTLEGEILAFGSATANEQSGNSADESFRDPSPALVPIVAAADARQAADRLLAAGDAEGYAIWYGSCQSENCKALAMRSPFKQLAIVDHDSNAVDRMRRQLDRAGLYGTVTAHHSTAESFLPPKYVANMVLIESDVHTPPDAGGAPTLDLSLVARLYQSVRPYGGVMHLLSQSDPDSLADQITAMKLEQAVVEVGPSGVLVRRAGALPGSADWTHQYGNIANTVKSDDSRVKLPLGVLWFGGSSNMDVLPRHGHGPPEQVVGGRLFIQGMNCLSARDVYTGRVLWKREFDNLGTFDVYFDNTYEDTPLNPKYNQVHIPGANGRGTNYVVTEDRVYLIEGSVCHALDPATGETIRDFVLPATETGESPNWGYIGIYENVLIGGVGFAMYRQRNELTFPSDKDLRSSKAGFGSKSLDRAASAGLVGFDRHSGQRLWEVKANHSFWHNGIVAGGDQIYCLDRNPKKVEDALRRRGRTSADGYRIVALDYRTGETTWEVTEGIFGTWLGYSQRHDLLLQAGARGSDRLYDEVDQGMAVYECAGGNLKWKNESVRYAGPCILHNDLIITNANSYSESAGAFYLRDGKPKLVRNPLTGQLQPWRVTRAYGCNNIIASENLLTFRSGAAGFYDLNSQAGTGNLGGFKSGCTSNLVVANGVLNAPDYTRTCSCAYQNQTSLGLVHMPDVELWSVNAAASVESEGKRLRQLGINFGAPGDRRGDDGLLWIEYPVVAGSSPPVSIELNPEASFFQKHSSTMGGTDVPWILASGVQGVTDIRIGMALTGELNMVSGIPVNHDDDDAEEDESGKVDRGSSDLELVNDFENQTVGVRFNRIDLDRNAEIRSAYIQFTCDEVSEQPTSLIIAAEDDGNAERFSSDSHDISSRSRTSSEVAWTPQPWTKRYASEKEHRTPDLSPLIAEVIGRRDWKPGNSIAFLFTGSGKRVAVSAKTKSDRSPKLVIDAQRSGSSNGVDAAESKDRYDVELFFAAPPRSPGSRFDLWVGQQRVAEELTIDPSDEEKRQATLRLQNIPIADHLSLRIIPKQGVPIVSGISIKQVDSN